MMPKRIVFVGTTASGLRCLECVLSLPELSVVGVITAPEVFSISYRPEGVRNVLYADISGFAARHGIPVHVQNGSMSDPALLEILRSWRPDLLLVNGWYHLIPKTIMDLAPVIGMHASLLPDYSGGAPLVWAMIHGERECGITMFQMDTGVDTGPIAGQAAVPIGIRDTIASVLTRVEEAGLALIREHLPRIARGEAVFTPQDETRRRRFPQRAPADGEIDWRWKAQRIYNFIRAQTRPYPGAFTYAANMKLKIWGAQLAAKPALSGELAGTVVEGDHGGEVSVVCGDGQLLVLTDVAYDSPLMQTGHGGQALPVRVGMILGRDVV
jgi:methionyl-tRNA formyltransferase